MKLTLEIPPDVQRELARDSEVRGVALPALAVHLLGQAVSAMRGRLPALAEFSEQIPPMPGETFPREMICPDHDQPRGASTAH